MNERPNLRINTITGGLLGVNAEIQNIGNTSASNIQWGIQVNGGLVLTGKTMNGTLATLAVNGTRRITDLPIIGIGAVTVKVTISADGVSEVTKTANGFVFVIFVKMG